MIRTRVSPSLVALLALSCAASCDDDSSEPSADASTIDGGHTVDGGIDSSTSRDGSVDGSLTDDQQQALIVTGLHDALLADLNNLKQAAQDLQNAAPTGHAWDDTQDA